MKKTLKVHQAMLLWVVAIVSSVALATMLAGCGGAAGGSTAPAAEEQQGTPSGEIASEEQETESEPEEEVEPEPEPEETPAVTTVELGQTYSNDDYDITFEEAYWDAANEEGSWKYYDGGSISYSLGGFDPNGPIFIIRTEITNKYTSAISPSWLFEGKAIVNGKYEYEVKVEESEASWTEIAPLETKEIYIYVAIPEAMKNQFENIKIDWGFDPKAESRPLKEGAYEVFELYFEE